jgi:hypothetical protein
MEMTGRRIAVSAASEMSCSAIAGSGETRAELGPVRRRRTNQQLQRATVIATQAKLQSNSTDLEDYTEAVFSMDK